MSADAEKALDEVFQHHFRRWVDPEPEDAPDDAPGDEPD